MEKLKQSAASQLALRKVKDHDPDFSTKTFPEKAQEIFIEAHNCLANFNKQKLHSLVTERCYPEMVRGNRYKTIRWSFVESLEPPRVVHVRCDSIINRGNLYGQVTVRMHTRQTLAIYDRFGRLMYGGEEVPKDVLEYVVFERYLVNPYGTWRMHGKIERSQPRNPFHLFWKSGGCHNLSAFPEGTYSMELSAYASFRSWRDSVPVGLELRSVCGNCLVCGWWDSGS
ncbi:39s ribosomal protein mitochondrial [Limosa lapponica baueri]|uniref:Large ribosomal subunit protein mL45 n=1 Tax=Limosa lapponica baueri TaxID=1758121 RepID=A0A2I0T327_LIMLA|nr:39s ribosomal protein mitochondrial [Limosa lapponica baueri]